MGRSDEVTFEKVSGEEEGKAVVCKRVILLWAIGERSASSRRVRRAVDVPSPADNVRA